MPTAFAVGIYKESVNFFRYGRIVSRQILKGQLLTLAAILAAGFRQGYLRRGVGSDLVCVGGAMILYELAVFTAGLLLELTYGGRWGVFVMTAIVSTLAAGVLYKPLKIIGTIGGNLWKE